MKKLLLSGLLCSVICFGSYAQKTLLAGWTFDATAAAPSTPTSVVANLGLYATSTIYADGTNGSSTFATSTSGNELTTFGGATGNDPRSTSNAGNAYSIVNALANNTNGKSIVIKTSTLNYKKIKISFDCRGTSTGFATHQWAYSTDATNWTNFGTNTGTTSTSFAVKSVDLSSISAVENQSVVYFRLTLSGASTTSGSGNNRLDNIQVTSDDATWFGTTSTDYSTASNWIPAGLASGYSSVPNSGVLNAVINQSSNNPIVTASLSIGNCTVMPKAVLTVSTFGNTYTVSGVLTLKSSSVGTGSIGLSTGTLNATNTVVERFVAGGKRAFRFLSHPFSSYSDLRQLTNQIDITGSGATASPTQANFTQSGSNAASAFWFDPTLADNGTNDAGWQAFTNTLPANATDANAWKVGQGIRVLVRGIKGEGLLGGTYTPSDVTLSMNGAVSVATTPIGINLTSNLIAGGGWNLVGNPLPSQIEVQAKLKALRATNTGGSNSNIGATAYVWNVNKLGTTKGGYEAIDLTAASTYVLPMSGVLLVQTLTNNNTALTFSEYDKTTATDVSLFRTTGNNNAIALQLMDANNNQLDETYIRFNNKTAATFESNDGGKLLNEYALYTTTSDNVKTYINSRPEPTDGEKIALGMYSGIAKDFVLKVNELELPLGTTVYLKDNFLNTQQEIEGNNFSYSFSTTLDAASRGAGRFELVFGKSVLPIAAVASSFSVKLSPNPAADVVKVNFTNVDKANTSISIVNAAGKTVKTVNAGNVQNGLVNINVKGLAKGNYYVILANGTETKTEKLIIQ